MKPRGHRDTSVQRRLFAVDRVRKRVDPPTVKCLTTLNGANTHVGVTIRQRWKQGCTSATRPDSDPRMAPFFSAIATRSTHQPENTGPVQAAQVREQRPPSSQHLVVGTSSVARAIARKRPCAALRGRRWMGA